MARPAAPPVMTSRTSLSTASRIGPWRLGVCPPFRMTRRARPAQEEHGDADARHDAGDRFDARRAGLGVGHRDLQHRRAHVVCDDGGVDDRVGVARHRTVAPA